MTFSDPESPCSQTTGARTRPPGAPPGRAWPRGRLGGRALRRGDGAQAWNLPCSQAPWGLTHFVEEAAEWTGVPGPAAEAQGPSGDAGPPGATRKRAELCLHTHALVKMPYFRRFRARDSPNAGKGTGRHGIRALGGSAGLQRQGQATPAPGAGNGSCGGPGEGSRWLIGNSSVPWLGWWIHTCVRFQTQK